MKNVSASIVILAGVLCFALGALVNHDDTSMFLVIVGGVVALVGFWGWLTKGPNEQ